MPYLIAFALKNLSFKNCKLSFIFLVKNSKKALSCRLIEASFFYFFYLKNILLNGVFLSRNIIGYFFKLFWLTETSKRKFFLMIKALIIRVFLIIKTLIIRVFLIIKALIIRVFLIIKALIIGVFLIIKTLIIRVFLIIKTLIIRVFLIIKALIIRVFLIIKISIFLFFWQIIFTQKTLAQQEARSLREAVISSQSKKFFQSNRTRQYLSLGGSYGSDYNSKSYQINSRYFMQNENFTNEINAQHQVDYVDTGSGKNKKYKVKK